MPVGQLSDLAAALLRVLASSSRDAPFVGTRQAADNVIEHFRATGNSFSLVGGSPWFGLSDAAHELQDLNLIDVDPGMASFVRPGDPAPTPDQFFLATSQAALTEALEAVPHLGPIRVSPTRSRGSSGVTDDCWIVTIDVRCGRETVMIEATAPSRDEALASALAKTTRRVARHL